MDQERDTTNNAKRSRPGRFRAEKSPKVVRPGDAPETPAPSYRGDFQEISDPTSARVDSAAEPLPTLFELPDRTPEGLQRKRDAGRVSIHGAHSGPPASHVDPPSGNHSHLSHSGPLSPDHSDSAMPGGSAMPAGVDRRSDSDPSRVGSPLDASESPDEARVAAYHDESMNWATAKASWATRSAIVMLVLLMVTLAFFSGRGLNRTGTTEDPARLTDVDAEDVEETVVMITEDIQLMDDAAAAEAPQAIIPDDRSAQIAQESPTADVPTETVDGTALDAPPSYIADGPAPAGMLGEPSAILPAEFDLANQAISSASAASEIPNIPPSFESNQSVVGFRSGETPNVPPTAATDVDSDLLPAGNLPAGNLPAGMEDRLRLEDGLRYSDTPYAIGNFLEILKAWEDSEQQ
ncbi:hypothetical protein Enr13x_68530 [Stieleria neptunia]|uniref:Transmembrane protein n=1 Tax=Stieleria neptunia TaxID=2527979 RepID=A0A518I1N5_9BACT|nr:hypothetical protein [Stieleria neptunia]QDV46944.1 hypothetical protein Enr13x_68530 [Stieleria neptunia]